MLGALRSGTATTRLMLAVLMACALLLRLGLPTGWMPVNDGLGFRITICDGMGATTMMSMADHDMPAHPGKAATDHGCPFAAAAVAIAGSQVLAAFPASFAAAVALIQPSPTTFGATKFGPTTSWSLPSASAAWSRAPPPSPRRNSPPRSTPSTSRTR
jgi:hypothetical protein